VRDELGFIPLVTPTSQIVGTQAVINVLAGERYKTITKETAGVLRGEYGATPAPVNTKLQKRVLNGEKPIACRPADLLAPELERQTAELRELARENRVSLAPNEIEDVLIYAQFQQVGWKFIQNRGNPAAFEPAPTGEDVVTVAAPCGPRAYDVTVNGKRYHVEVAPDGSVGAIQSRDDTPAPAASPAPQQSQVKFTVNAPMAGTILRVTVEPGQRVEESDVVVVMEAMKMETEIRTRRAGTVLSVAVKRGDAVTTGDVLVNLS
jgi:oxaloacetate decarboxylase alpha subunit